MTNRLEDEIALTVIIDRDGAIALWESRTVPPANANPEDDFLGDSYSFRDKEAMGCGTFEVTVRQRNTEKWATVDFRELRPARGKQIKPVKLDVEISEEDISVTPARIDEFFSCAENEIVSEEEYSNTTTSPG